MKQPFYITDWLVEPIGFTRDFLYLGLVAVAVLAAGIYSNHATIRRLKDEVQSLKNFACLCTSNQCTDCKECACQQCSARRTPAK